MPSTETGVMPVRGGDGGVAYARALAPWGREGTLVTPRPVVTIPDPIAATAGGAERPVFFVLVAMTWRIGEQ